MTKHRIFLVDRKQVAIIKSNEHTYNVRFVKSGKFMEIYKKYVKSYYPKPKSAKQKPTDQQQKLNL